MTLCHMNVVGPVEGSGRLIADRRYVQMSMKVATRGEKNCIILDFGLTVEASTCVKYLAVTSRLAASWCIMSTCCPPSHLLGVRPVSSQVS